MFDEVHGNQVPGLVQDWKLLEITIWFMSWCFGPSASRARLTIILDKRTDIRPCIIPLDEIQCLVLTIMTGDRVMVTVE